MNERTACIVFLALVTALAAPARAQEEGRDNGFYLGMRFATSGLGVDDDAESGFFVKEDGGGVQLYTGYSFNPVFSLQLELGGARHETSVQAIDAGFGSVALLAHYRFAPGKDFRPFIKGGLAGYGLVLTDNQSEVRIEGGGAPIGGGFDFFFSRHFSLGVDFTYNIIAYNKVTVDLGEATAGFDIDEDGAQASLGLALAYYF
jgi:hypothetical protein